MNIIKVLRESFPNIAIEEQKTPSYIQCHLDESENIILVLKRYSSPVINLSPSTQFVTPKKREQNTLHTSEFELTGSPLKLDLGYEKLDESLSLEVSTIWTQEENTHEPLSIEEARNVVNLFNSKARVLSFNDFLPLWVVCNGQDSSKTLLISSYSCKSRFNRGIVKLMDAIPFSKLSVEKLKEVHWKICSSEKPLTSNIEGIFRVSGKHTRNENLSNKDLYNSYHNGMTQLKCKWSKLSFQVPAHETDIQLVQEVIVGHSLSECTPLWKSVCAIQGIRNALSTLSSILTPNNMTDISLKPFNSTSAYTLSDLECKLQELLNDVEDYSVLPHTPKGGCICITDDCTTLNQVFKQYYKIGSSNDFTYKLWDILKECSNVEDLSFLFVRALKDIYKRNLRPFIDPGNTTYIGVLVKKLARGISQQAIKCLSTFHTNPMKTLNIIGQLGIFKISWEYTNIFSLVDNALAFNNRLRLQNKVSEINEEVYNQTVLEMTLGSGDVTVNPFDTKFNLMDSTVTQESETTLCDNLDLSLDNFASLKKHNIEIKTERRLPTEDQPLISDDTDIELTPKEWKFKLTRLAQLHLCMEHLYRAQSSLNCDFNTLKPIIAQLLDHYTADDSPVKTIDQLNSESVQSYSLPIAYKIVKDHLQFKHANSYKVVFNTDYYENENKEEPPHLYQSIKSTFFFSQQPSFPPNIFSRPDTWEETNDVMYHGTHYTYLSNNFEY